MPVVLTFVVSTVAVVILLGVGEGTDNAQRVVILLVTVFQVETASFVRFTLHVALRVTAGYGRSLQQMQWYLRMQPEQRPVLKDVQFYS
ncbi:Uncharacterised protein [Klebsiella pneumoniae]|uniref:Uncharacterized protein n=1 Tax=Klebsiella pneumoniae TaxID=573 RepID=A0A3S4HFG4_KLEPN|nr:Uncharacterised protein [Klebsiella pneumoniae]